MPKSAVSFWLLASVHRDAFLSAPISYLTAAWWWLRRKKVRARGQFAPLLARSPNAYAIWLKQAKGLGSSLQKEEKSQTIIALVDRYMGQGDISATLNSLAAEGITALLVGSSEIPTVSAAARHIDWDLSPWIMPIMAGDIIAEGAANRYCAVATKTDTVIFYADDDLIDANGRRHSPHFKPDWNYELFCHHDYLTGACIVRADHDGLASLSDKADWAKVLVQQAAERGGVHHIPEMLHHRRDRPPPVVPLATSVLHDDWPSVSIIIPTRNRKDLLETCIKGIEATDYPEIEVLIVDNDSDDPEILSYFRELDPDRYKVLPYPGPFNYSAINNHAVQQASGQLICLLNNDIEMIGPDWLKVMTVQAMRNDVGAVGALLLYPDGRIQHAGVVMGVGNAAGHAHRFLRPNDEGYFHRHSLPQFTLAVTAACLLVQKERFFAVGGLNETDFAVAFNDVDLCLRLNQHGWQSFYEPRATLIHHESVSRGLDRDTVGAARFARELAALQRIWHTDEITDPFHHSELSRATEQFVIGL